MFNYEQRPTTEKYRDGWDAIFKAELEAEVKAIFKPEFKPDKKIKDKVYIQKQIFRPREKEL